MIYIFDLDSTLLNTQKLRCDLARSMGLTVNEFDARRQKLHAGKGHYSLFRHIEHLRQSGALRKSYSSLPRKTENIIKRLDEYLFAATTPLLNLIARNRDEMVLITRGNKEWQQAKIDHLSIVKYFSRVIVTEGDKTKSLRYLKMEKAPKITVINDRPGELLILKKFFGRKCRILLVKGAHNRDFKHNLEAHSLSEVYRMIKNEYNRTNNR